MLIIHLDIWDGGSLTQRQIESFFVAFWPTQISRDLQNTFICNTIPISGRVDRASATETVDSGWFSGRVKPKTIKIGIHRFPA